MSYNGHKNYAAWNVSLWINNDEGLYRKAKRLIRRGRGKDYAAEVLYGELEGQSTPDGVRYTKSNIRAALVGFE